jgi:hypothetical protein
VKVDFRFGTSDTEASTARPATLLGRAEQSSPAPFGAPLCGLGLDGEGAGQAMIGAAVMSVLSVIELFLENAHRTEWQTGPLQPSIPCRAAWRVARAAGCRRPVRRFAWLAVTLGASPSYSATPQGGVRLRRGAFGPARLIPPCLAALATVRGSWSMSAAGGS